MKVKTARNGKVTGDWALPELQAALDRGEVLATDLVWKEGWSEWRKLPDAAAELGVRVDVGRNGAPPAPPATWHDGTSPALWNPNAAALWSLLFTPIFGAFLHSRNWQVLGEPEKAATATKWFYGSIAFLVLSVLVPDLQILTLPFLFLWYFMAGREQVSLVKKRFGGEYDRKGWGKPLGIAFSGLAGLIVLMGAVESARLGSYEENEGGKGNVVSGMPDGTLEERKEIEETKKRMEDQCYSISGYESNKKMPTPEEFRAAVSRPFKPAFGGDTIHWDRVEWLQDGEYNLMGRQDYFEFSHRNGPDFKRRVVMFMINRPKRRGDPVYFGRLIHLVSGLPELRAETEASKIMGVLAGEGPPGNYGMKISVEDEGARVTCFTTGGWGFNFKYYGAGSWLARNLGHEMWGVAIVLYP